MFSAGMEVSVRQQILVIDIITNTSCSCKVCNSVVVPTITERIQEFTRGGAQTCHGSWGCTDDCTLAADDHFFIVPCC